MNKITIILITVTILILGGGAFLLTKNNNKPIPSPEPNTYQYFWGNGCPHCENVAKFEETWDRKDKIKINKKEVWSNPNNANIMIERAKSCGLKQSDLAVPFLVTPEGRCLQGDQEIINLYKSLNI